MPTIKDVAEKAGVSVTTVSRILNNRGYISDKTRKKVYQIMEEINYQPNELARNLFKKKSNMVGVIVPDVAHPFFASLVSRLEHYLFIKGYKMLLCNAYEDANKEKDYINMLKRNQVAGIITASHNMRTQDYLRITLPVVAVTKKINENIPYIDSNNYEGAKLAVLQLIEEKKCKKIAHITGPLNIKIPANERREAFKEIARQKNIEHFLIETEINKSDNFYYENAVYDFLKNHKDIDGIFASNDTIALAAIKAAKRLNLKVPEDIKVIGYDDIELAQYSTPSLTTIKQPIDKLAEKSVEILLKLIDNKYDGNYEIIFPIELIKRESC